MERTLESTMFHFSGEVLLQKYRSDVQPRIMSTVPVCLLICHENKATLFTRKLEQQYVLTSEMKNFIAPWQIMAR